MWCVEPILIIQGVKCLSIGDEIALTLPIDEITKLRSESRGVVGAIILPLRCYWRILVR